MSMTSLRRMGVGGLVALSMVGMALQGCTSLKPRMKNESVSSVSVAFDPTVLGDLAQNMKTLQVRVFSVQNDQVAGQEGGDLKYPIEAQKKEYSIDKVKLGLKEIEVSILNESDLALGTGKVRVLVKPGENKTDPVVIKLKKIDSPVSNISLSFTFKGTVGEQDINDLIKRAEINWKTEASSQSGTTQLVRGLEDDIAGGTSYTEIKPLLDSNCISCHSETTSLAKLKLDRFPFVSAFRTDKAELMSEVMARIQDEEAPMPPSDLMESQSIDLFKKWEGNGFALSSAPSNGKAFTAQLSDLRVSDKLTGTIIVYGDNDEKLAEKEITPYTVEENGLSSQEIEMSLPAPSVSIPVVVEAE